MAVGATISLCASNWEPSMVRSDSVNGPKVNPLDLRAWLHANGFKAEGAARDIFVSEAIECYLHEVEGEVAFLSFTFRPLDDAMARVEGWEALCVSASNDWGFQLIPNYSSSWNFRGFLGCNWLVGWSVLKCARTAPLPPGVTLSLAA